MAARIDQDVDAPLQAALPSVVAFLEPVQVLIKRQETFPAKIFGLVSALHARPIDLPETA